MRKLLLFGLLVIVCSFFVSADALYLNRCWDLTNGRTCFNGSTGQNILTGAKVSCSNIVVSSGDACNPGGAGGGGGFSLLDNIYLYNNSGTITFNETKNNATILSRINAVVTQAFITALGFDISTTIKGWISTNSTADRSYTDTHIDSNYTVLNARDNAINTSSNIQALVNNTNNYNISIPWNHFTNPDKNMDISMGAYNSTFRLGNSAGGFLFNYQGAFTNHGFEINQNIGNPGAGTHLVHIEAADNDVLPFHVTHNGNPATGVAVFEGNVNITSNVTVDAVLNPFNSSIKLLFNSTAICLGAC